MAAEASPTEVLSKRGDVILHVGRAPHTERKLLVSSVLLSHVSPVFAAMFDGRFAEGQTLSSDSPRMVLLPEDSAEHMAIVCKIIHVQLAGIGVTTTPAQLMNIAIIAHKYDCAEAMRAWGIIWVMDLLQNPNVPDFENVFLATYLLNMAPEFQKVSKMLIRDRSEPLSSSAMSNDQAYFPPPLLERIAKKQHEAQRRALAALGPLVPVEACDNIQREAAWVLRKLRESGYWPLSQLSVAELRTHLEQMSQFDQHRNKCHLYGCLRATTHGKVAKNIYSNVSSIYNGVNGVCLDCAKNFEVCTDHPTCYLGCADTLTGF